MKIVIDARFYGSENGGLGRYTIQLIEQYKKLDAKNEYILLLRAPWYRKLKLPPNFKKVQVYARHYSLREQFEVPHIIEKINPDITHFLHFNVPLLFRGKYVVTIHDLLMHKGVGKQATTLSPIKYQIKRLGYRRVFDHAVKSAEHVIVPSQFVSKQLGEFYPGVEKKVSVIYEGVSYLSKGDTKKDKDTSPYFLYVGNAYPHKNVNALIDAIVMYNKNNPHKASLRLVTPRDTFTKRLKEYIEKANAENLVELHSLISDQELYRLYANALAFIYPSFSEGFGLQGLEAMHAKTRLIASDIPVFHEVYGKNAVYVDPHSNKSITDAMAKVVIEADAKRKISLQKAHDFSKKYSWEKMAAETIMRYRQYQQV